MKRMTAVCLSLWLLLLTACSGSKDQEKAAVSVEGVSWPVFRGDSNLSGVAASGLSDRLRLLWSYQTGSYIVSSPVLGFGNVYIGSTDGKVYSLSLSDGGKVWEFDTGDDIETSPLLMGGSVYIGNLSGDSSPLTP